MMTVRATWEIVTDRQYPEIWSRAVAEFVNNLVASPIFRIVLSAPCHDHPFSDADLRNMPEDPMVAKGTDSGDPRSKAVELAECIGEIANRRSEAAFEILFRYFAPRIKSFCLRLGADSTVAEEITQEAMVSIWRHAARYDPSKASPSTWIFAIARNLSIDRFRKSRRPEFDPDDPAFVPDDPQGADGLMERLEMEAVVRGVLDSLSSKERDVLMLSFYEDRSHGEISRQLGLPLGTVKSRIRLAFAKIRSALEAQDGADN
jgi:RNA polymerase sigma-70 factor (ECF subfamily)